MIREDGPTFVVNRAMHEIAAVFWEFNAWGNKYDELLFDGIRTVNYFKRWK